MACRIEDIEPKRDGIDFVMLEKVITDVCDNGAIVKELLYSALRTTETYNRCITEYNNYLTEYVQFMASLGITDAVGIALTYKKMLDDGYLSYNRKCSYDNSYRHIYNSNLNMSSFMDLDELEGCYIATGSFVCRHMSTFLTELEGRAGENSYNGYVAAYRRKKHKNYIAKLRPYNNILANHQITYIDNNGFYGYCPTSGLFIQLENYYENKFDKEDTIIYGRSIDIDDFKIGDFYYYSSYKDYCNITDDTDNHIISLFKENNTKQFKRINIPELQEKEKNIQDIYNRRKNEFEEFYYDTKDYLNDINNYMKVMVPKKNLKSLLIK